MVADKTVAVKVTIRADDQLTPALEKLKQKAKTQLTGPHTTLEVPSLLAQKYAHEERRVSQLAREAPAKEKALHAEEMQNVAGRRTQLHNQALEQTRKRVAAELDAEQEARDKVEAEAGGGGGRGRRGLAGMGTFGRVMFSQAVAGMGGGRPGVAADPLSGVARVTSAFSALPGPVGLVATGLTAVVAVAGYLRTAFQDVRESAEQVHATYQQQLSDLRAGRQTGLSPADTLRRALTPEEQARLANAQAGGNQGAALAVLQGAQGRLRAQAAEVSGPQAAQNVAQAQQELQALETRSRGAWWQFTHNARALNRQREEILGRYLPAGQVPFLGDTSRPMTGPEIQNLASLAGGQSVQAQSGLQALRNVFRSGAVPNLAPGAANLEELPGLFRSRQTDVLDIHAEVQREAVRDQREENRFQAQMTLWEEIQRDIQRLQIGAS